MGTWLLFSKGKEIPLLLYKKTHAYYQQFRVCC